MPRITNILHPERWQGAGQRRNYFEGYYLKIVDAERNIALALIPGVSYDADGQGHAFIQVLDGVAGTAAYHRFDLEDFAFAKTGFEIRIAAHVFSSQSVQVSLPDVEVQVGFRQNITWRSRWYSPGAMGPFSFVPAMECNHGVVSMHHIITGEINGQTLTKGSRGYIEKDWGRSFPAHWVWLQTNHLANETQPCCLMVSAGKVPFSGLSFTGFIAALHWRGRFLPFTTYNLSRMDVTLGSDVVQLTFCRKALRLEIEAHHAPGVELVAPVQTEGMLGRVNESLLATAKVKLYEADRLILDTSASYMGFEVGGQW